MADDYWQVTESDAPKRKGIIDRMKDIGGSLAAGVGGLGDLASSLGSNMLIGEFTQPGDLDTVEMLREAERNKPNLSEGARKLAGGTPPTTRVGRYVDAALQGIGGGLVTGPLSLGSAPLRALPRIMAIETAAGGLGGLGQEVGQEIGGTPGAVIGALALGAGGGMGAARVTRPRTILPVKGSVSSAFGRRSAPKAGASSQHGGVDLKSKVGTPFVASADGVVTKLGRNHSKRGNWVEVDYGGGVTSRYLHLQDTSLKVGDQFEAGSVLGRTGKSGNVTGPHLHWSVMKDGKPVDPMTFKFSSQAGPGVRGGRREGELAGSRRQSDNYWEMADDASPELNLDELHPAVRDRLTAPEVEPELKSSSRNAEEFAFQKAIADHASENNLDHVEVGRKYFDEGPENPELVRSVNYRARQIAGEMSDGPQVPHQVDEFSPEMSTAQGHSGEMDFGPKGTQDVAVFSTEGLQRKLQALDDPLIRAQAFTQAREQGLPVGEPISNGAGGNRPPRKPPESDLGGSGGGRSTGGGDSPSEPPRGPSGEDPVLKLQRALKEAVPIRKKQEAGYSRARARKFSDMNQVRQYTSGQEGFYAELGALKGELPKQDFSSVMDQFTQPDLDHLFDMVKNNPRLGMLDTINARKGLTKMLEGRVPTDSEIDLLSRVFPKELVRDLMKSRTLMQRFQETSANVLNIPRALMSSYDVSAPFRQGIFLAGRKEFYPAMGEMFKHIRTQSHEEITNAIIARPTYKLMQKAKLALADTNSPFLVKREEDFMSSLAEKIPVIGRGVKVSNQAYSGFLNTLRADTFDSIIKHWDEVGFDYKEDPKTLKDLGRYLNTATGRGDLGQFNQAVPFFNTMLFSPRLIASRIQLMNPLFYARLDPMVRKQAFRDLLSFGGAANTILGLTGVAAAAGILGKATSVSGNPTSPDFGKIKVGDTRFDITGGFQPYLRLASQLASGVTTSSTSGKVTELNSGKFGSPTKADKIGEFLASKESPLLSFLHEQFGRGGRNAVGEEVPLTEAALERVTPMMIGGAVDAYKEYGPAGLLTVPPSALGVGVQTYGGEKKSAPAAPVDANYWSVAN